MTTISKYNKYKRYLSKEEEKDLFYKMKSGDEDARAELILAHSYMIIKLANEYEKYGSREDLEQEGWIALTKSVDAYDVEKGRLRVYAYQTVRNFMIRCLAKSKDFIRLPDPQVQQLLFLIKIRNKLAIELQKDPTYEDLARNKEVLKAYKDYSKTKNTKFTLSEYIRLLEFSDPISSLNYPVSEDSEIMLEDLIEDPNSRSEHEKLEKENLGNAVMEILEDREKFILKALSEGRNGKEIGDILGVSTQAISVAKRKAIEKVKCYVKDNSELEEMIKAFGFCL